MNQIKLIVTILFAMVTTVSWSQRIQSKQVPAKVKESFAKRFPEIVKINWDKEAANYEASFIKGKKKCSALINNVGTIIETEVATPFSKFPPKVKEYMKRKYPNRKVKETATISRGTETIYEVEIKEGDLLFNEKGEFIKQ